MARKRTYEELEQRIRDLEEESVKAKRAEVALQASEKRYRRLFQSAKDGILILDADTGKVVDVNPFLTGLIGYSYEALCGKRIWEIGSFTDIAASKEAFRTLQDQQYIRYEDLPLKTNDGRLVEVEFVSNVYQVDHSKVIQCNIRDISDRKRAEEEIRRSESRLRSLLSISQYHASNTQDFLDYALDEAIKLTGSKIGYIYHYSEERREFVLNSWSKDVMKECTITKPQTCYELDKTGIWGEAVRQGKPIVLNDFQADHPLKRGYPEGHAKLHNYLTIPVSSGGRIVAVVGVANKEFDYGEGDVLQLSLLMDSVFNLVDLRKAEEALKESEASLAHAQSIAHLANWEVDVETDKVRGSTELYRIFNLEGELTLGAYVEKFHPDDRAYIVESINAAIYEGKPYNIDYRIIPRSGDIRHVHAEGEVTHDENGRPKKFFGIVHDITERKRAEEALRSLNAELERRVRERTAELEQRNRDLENFTFVAAHQLQEPLRKIQTFADLVSVKHAEGTHEQGRYYLQRMQGMASKMRHLLQALLEYSRLTAEAEPFTRVSLNQIAHEVISDLEVQIRESGATVEIGELPEIDADGRQLSRLFYNLIANGVKFRREGEISRVKIHADSSEESKSGACEIYFEDNGIGLDEKYQDRIFVPFQCLHRSTEYGGVGMGLAICKRVMERHKGTIRVKSTPGRGSTFILTLPTRHNH
jgi:two-component system, sensor histidine kinase and response regulator